ncbi:hypothetical protein BH20ACI3_BH20ACI3_05210 [soil metagenome]
MLDEGQAIVFVKEFTLETFIEPRCCSNSDFGTPIGQTKKSQGHLAVSTVKELVISTVGKT